MYHVFLIQMQLQDKKKHAKKYNWKKDTYD